MKIPFAGWIGAGSFLIGTFGGGWVVHKVWYGKSQADKLKISEASLKATEKSLADSVDMAVKAAEAAQIESEARNEAEMRLSRAYQDNALLAQSRASTTTRIIEKGDEIGQELKSEYPCLYEPWPLRLRSYAFGGGPAEVMSGSAAGGYPEGE